MVYGARLPIPIDYLVATCMHSPSICSEGAQRQRIEVTRQPETTKSPMASCFRLKILTLQLNEAAVSERLADGDVGNSVHT